jgi:hypothetical protein
VVDIAAENNNIDGIVATLRTKSKAKYNGSDCTECFYEYDGEIIIFYTSEEFVDQQCPLATTSRVPGNFYSSSSGELFNLESGTWRGCLEGQELVSVPVLYVEASSSGYYLGFMGGVEQEQDLAAEKVSEYDFFIFDIVETFEPLD